VTDNHPPPGHPNKALQDTAGPFVFLRISRQLRYDWGAKWGIGPQLKPGHNSGHAPTPGGERLAVTDSTGLAIDPPHVRDGQSAPKNRRIRHPARL